MEDFLLGEFEDTQWSIENNTSSSAIFEEDIISSTPKSVVLGSEPDKDISYSELYGNGLNESKLKVEYEDLYEDLIVVEEETKKAELNRDAEYKRMKEEYEVLKNESEAKDKKIKELVTDIENVKRSMCSLYKTCKAEIERRECLAEAAKKEATFSWWKAKQCSTCKQKCPFCNTADGSCKRKRSESPESNKTKPQKGTTTTSSESDLPSAKNVNTNILSISQDRHANVSQNADNHKVHKSYTHEIRDNDTCELQKSDSGRLEKSEPHNSHLEDSKLDKGESDTNKSQKSDDYGLEKNAKLQSDDKRVAAESFDINGKFNKVVPESVKVSFLDFEQNQIQLMTTFKKSLIKAYDNSDVNVQSSIPDSTSKELSTSKKFHPDNRSGNSSVSSRSSIHASSSHRRHNAVPSEHFDDSDNAHHSKNYRNRNPIRRDDRPIRRRPYRKPYERSFGRN